MPPHLHGAHALAPARCADGDAVQVASAWRATLRPRRARWPAAAAALAIAACLGVWLWTHHAIPAGEPVRVEARR